MKMTKKLLAILLSVCLIGSLFVGMHLRQTVT